MTSNIPPRLRRNRMIANLEYLLNDKLEKYCFITPKFIMQEYDDVADNFTLQEELDFFDTTIFDLLEKNFPNTYFLHRDGDEPGFLRKSMINQPLQLVKTGDLACIEPADKQMAIQYGEVGDSETKQQVTPASTISKFLDEDDEPSNHKDASVSDADSAYSTSESDQQIWSVVDTKIVEKTDDCEALFCSQSAEAQKNDHVFEEYEGSLASQNQINDLEQVDESQQERSVCPPPGFEQRVSWPLYNRKTKVKSPDVTRQEISLEWSKNANSVPIAHVKLLNQELSVDIPAYAPKSERTLDKPSELNVEKIANDSAKSPLYLELLVGVPPPGYSQATNKALYSSMARKPKDGADVELAELLHKVSDAKKEVKRTVRNANENRCDVNPVYKPSSQPSSVTPNRSSLDSGLGTSKNGSTGQLSHDLAVESSENKQREFDEGYFCESDFECDPELAAPVPARSFLSLPVKSSPLNMLASPRPKKNINIPEVKVVCKPICYSLRGDLIQNYEAASEYRRKQVRNCLFESVESIVQDWAYTFPNISLVIRLLMKLRDQYPKGCTPLQVSLFEKCVRKQFEGMELSDMLPPFPMMLEEGLLLVSKGTIIVAPQVGSPNFICLRKNFVSNLYRLLLSRHGFSKVDDLIPFLKQLAPKNFLIKKENILNICNRLPLVFLLEAYKGLDGYRYEHAVVRLNPDIPDWRIVLDCETNEFDCQVCDCSGCRLIS